MNIFLATSAAATVTLAGIVIDEKTAVPIGTVCAVAAVFGSGIWWLGRCLQKLQDGQERLREGQIDIHRRLGSLPCEKCGFKA